MGTYYNRDFLFSTEPPTLIALAAGFASLMGHYLLTSHEANRKQRAKIFADESIALNRTLNENIVFFNEAGKKLNQATEALNAQTENVKAHTTIIDIETKKVQKNEPTLNSATDMVSHAANQLSEQQGVIDSSFQIISTHLLQCDRVVLEFVEKVGDLVSTTIEISGAVKELQQSHQSFSQATNNFCHFVTECVIQIGHNNSQSNEDSDLLTRLLKQNEEDDALLKSLGFKENENPSMKLG